MQFFSKYSIYLAEQPQPRFIWVKNHINVVKSLKTAKIVEKWGYIWAKMMLSGQIGIRYQKKIISKYSIYHAEQPPPRFIWVKITLKWSKCPKTAQIVEKCQQWGHLGPKLRHRAKLGLGTEKFKFKVFHLSC